MWAFLGFHAITSPLPQPGFPTHSFPDVPSCHILACRCTLTSGAWVGLPDNIPDIPGTLLEGETRKLERNSA